MDKLKKIEGSRDATLDKAEDLLDDFIHNDNTDAVTELLEIDSRLSKKASLSVVSDTDDSDSK